MTPLMGRGVSCRTTCDGALYRGKTIAVIITAAHSILEYLAEKEKAGGK